MSSHTNTKSSTSSPNVPLVGINIGGTSTTLIWGNSAGSMYDSMRIPTDTRETGEAFYQKLLAAIRTRTTSPLALGVAVGGPMNARTGTILEAQHLPHLHGFQLRDRLMEDAGLPVRVHHDAAACALAEYRWGADAGAGGIAYLTCGTGFGAGLVFDGRARYGRDGFSPEIGHVRFRDTGPNLFGKPGCYEGYGSANALALLARDTDAGQFASHAPADIVAAAQSGNPVAVKALRDNIEAVGSAAALLADTLALDVVSLGSLAAYLGDAWVRAVNDVFSREALAYNVEHCTVRAAMANVQDLSALAAACDAWEESQAATA